MPKYLSTIYKDFNEKVVDSTTNIIPNLQSTKSLAPPLRRYYGQQCGQPQGYQIWKNCMAKYTDKNMQTLVLSSR